MRLIDFTPAIGSAVRLGIQNSATDFFLIEKLDGLEIPAVNLQTQKAPFQDGETFIDALLKTREIVIQGAINTQDLAQIGTLRTTLINAFNSKLGVGSVKVYTDTYPVSSGGLTATGIAVKCQFKNKDFIEPFQRFSITIECLDPYFYLDSPSPTTLARNTPVVINNPGGAGSPATFVITGPCTNPKVANESSSEFIKINKTLAAGDVLTIVTYPDQLSVELYDDSLDQTLNVIGYVIADSTFWTFAAGNNTVRYTEDGTDAGYCEATISPRMAGI